MSAANGTRPLVVFGDDASTGADAAWLWVNMQTWPGWDVEVFTAVLPAIGPPPGPERGSVHTWSPPEPRRGFAEARISDLRHTTAEADPRHTLTVRGDAALLVIGGRGSREERGLREFHIGSTAEFLVHRPPTPLVIARHATTVRRVVAGVDGSPHAERALGVLAGLPWASQIEGVTLLSIEDGDTDTSQALATARSILGEIPADEVIVPLDGNHADRVLDMAAQSGAQLVVLGTRGRSPIRRLLAGSTASSVVSHSPVSVLLAHVD